MVRQVVVDVEPMISDIMGSWEGRQVKFEGRVVGKISSAIELPGENKTRLIIDLDDPKFDILRADLMFSISQKTGR
jgi:hypothetical protein